MLGAVTQRAPSPEAGELEWHDVLCVDAREGHREGQQPEADDPQRLITLIGKQFEDAKDCSQWRERMKQEELEAVSALRIQAVWRGLQA